MVAAFMFIMIALAFYLIYESVFAENKEKKDNFDKSRKDKE